MPDSAVTTLRNAENSALSTSEQSYYTGNGRSADGENKAKKKNKTKTFTVVAILAGLLGGGGAFLSMSHSMFPFQLSANAILATDTQQVATQNAFNRIFKGLLRGDSTSVTVPTNEIPDALAARMENNNFTVDGDVVTWTDTVHNTTSTITADNYDSFYYDNYLFRQDADALTFDRAGNYYDNGALAAYDNVGESRNVFHNYKQTGNFTADVDAFDETMFNSFEKNSTSLRSYVYGTEEETITVTDDDGNTTTETIYVPREYDAPESVKSKGEKNTRYTLADSQNPGFRTTIDKLARVGEVGTYACQAMQVGTMFVSAVAGLETYLVLRYALEQLENVSKTQAGYGDNSAIHAMMTHFTTNTENVSIPDYSSINSNEITGEQNISGAGAEDPNLLSIVSGTPASKSAAKNFSVERLAVALGGSVTMGAIQAKTCAFAAAGANVLSLVSVGLSIGSGGIVGVSTYIINKFFTLGVFKTIFIGAIIGLAAPAIMSLLANFFVQTVGQAIGAQTASGFIPSMSNLLGRVSAQTISDKDEIHAFNHENQALIAREAEIDRKTRSPFDMTNKNTFLGSIAQSLSAFTLSSSFSKVSSLLHATSSSLAALTGRVSAEGEGSSYITTYGDCPMLESVGAVGDVYCHPITVSDTKTFSIDYDDPNYVRVIKADMEEATDSNGNKIYKIRNNSDLAKYISFCDGRESIYGVIDYNILNANRMGNVVVNNIPIVGNVIGAFDSIRDIVTDENIDWATGKMCGNTHSSDPRKDNSQFWQEKGQYYQTYINAQRVYSQTGAYDETDNPVYAYQEEYNAEHPKDNSLEGIIARYSGLTMEDTETVLAFVDYYQFLNDYDADTRIALDGEINTTLTSEQAIAKIERGNYKDIQESTVGESAEVRAIANRYVIYADIRNRSYAIC